MFYAISKQPSLHCTFSMETPRLQDCGCCCCCKQTQLDQELSWNACSTGKLAKLTSPWHRYSAATHKMRDTELSSVFAILVQAFSEATDLKKEITYGHICLQSHLHIAIFAYNHICIQSYLHTLSVSIWPHRWWVTGYKLEEMDVPMILGKTDGISNGHLDKHAETKDQLVWKAGQTQPLSPRQAVARTALVTTDQFSAMWLGITDILWKGKLENQDSYKLLFPERK